MTAAFRSKFKRRGVDSVSESILAPKRDGRAEIGWVFVLLTLVSGCHGDQRFAMEPQDQNAILGTRVTLPCRVENKAGELQWTKDHFGLGTDRNLSGFDRYVMIGSDEEGDYSLDIRDVSLEDDAIYQCQVSSAIDGSPAIRSRYAQLTVLVAPDPPRIVQGAFIDATEKKPIDIECVSVGGKPAAELTWLDEDQNVLTDGIKNTDELMPDGHRLVSRSVMHLVPLPRHHNKTFTCQAQNTADRAPRVATVHLEVRYAPRIKMFVKFDGSKRRILEGSDARLRCEADANPKDLVYRWFINNRPIIGDYVEELVIFNVTRNQNDAVIKCEVTNSVDKSEETEILEVSYPPSFVTYPKNGAAEIGGMVTLSCEADGQPTPEITWLQHEPGRIGVKGKASNLRVKVSNETAGRYTCKASVPDYPEIEADANVFIKGPPKIVSNRTQYGIEGEMVTVECASLSFPKPDDIRWYFQGREINIIHDQDYAPIEESLSDGKIKASLVIRASQPRHYGVYNCSVTNELGNDNVAILLKPYKTLPLLLILVGVTSGIVAFSAFIVLLVLCNRRRRNSAQKMGKKPDVTVTSADIYKESDRSSNISDLKLPHTDGSYELDYSNGGSDNTMGSNLKLAGLPLAGPVALPNIRDDHLMQFRYSNDYSDPTYNDYYKGYTTYPDYNQEYGPPAIRVQSPTQPDVPINRSLQGSLTRSIDTASTVPLTNSQNNSLQRSTNTRDETDAINNLGLPSTAEAQTPVYAQPNKGGNTPAGQVTSAGLDLRYAATYGNPYLRSATIGFGNQVHTAKPASTPAPPPYSAVRSSVLLPSGNGSQPSQATHV